MMRSLNDVWYKIDQEVYALDHRYMMEQRQAKKGKETWLVRPAQGFLPIVAARHLFALVNDRAAGEYAQGIHVQDLSVTFIPTLRWDEPTMVVKESDVSGAKWYLCVALDLIGRRGELVGFVHKTDAEYTGSFGRESMYPWVGLPFRLPEKRK